MLDRLRLQNIDATVGRICDPLRVVGVPADIKELALALLLLRYLSDAGDDLGDERRRYTQVVVPEGSRFSDLYAARLQPGNGQRIDNALCSIEKANAEFRGIFQGITFDATQLGSVEQRDRLLRQLLEVFSADALYFRADGEEAADAVSYACDSLIARLAEGSGREGGGFGTPLEIAQLIARLMQPSAGDAVGDPCCGSGALLIACSKEARQRPGNHGCFLYGQEKSGSTWALAKMSMLLHGEMRSQLEWGDVLRDPKLLTHDGRLRQFDIVVSNPPLSLQDWGYEVAERDAHGRYWRGVPPRATGDYAFISHMVETLKPQTGRMAVVVSLGVLFRGAAERQIRERLLDENLIDTVIALPPKMLSHTGIQVAILVLRRDRTHDGVLFIDASRSYQPGKLRNVLRDSDVDAIESAYVNHRDVSHFARLATRGEIAANDYNLTVSRYVGAVEEEPGMDLDAIREERARIAIELAGLESKLAALLKATGYA